MNRVHVKIPDILINEIRTDLRRPHKYAHERVGFCYGKSQLTPNGWIVILTSYRNVPDDFYIRTNEVGARINSKAITEAIQEAYTNESAVFHIHLHDFGDGMPGFSSDDVRSARELIPSIQGFVGTQVHGAIVLSPDSFNAIALVPDSSELFPVQQISSPGTLLKVAFPSNRRFSGTNSNRYSRQEFLGNYSEAIIKNLRVGVVGLSGGGSHIVQQIAHIGFEKYALADPECIDDDSNLNRIVGATLDDARKERPKFEVFSRLIKALHPKADIQGGKKRWEDIREELKDCDIIFGCLDTVLGRRDLENFCRRFFIPYIDIGMGVETSSRPYAMFGQVQLSAPGHSCLRCNGFLTEDSLKKEANNYGQKTKRPQVVWPNGVLASTAVGIAMDMLFNWSESRMRTDYLSYNGNDHSINDHLMKEYRKILCEHFPIREAGPVSL
jgi:molybdopterin/thiamine biosynthesis adenylyltransferase